MKNLITLLSLGLCLFSAACKKESTPTSLVGQWKLTETHFSPGGPGKWHPVADPKLAALVEFKANGVYSSTNTLVYDRYELADSASLILSASANPSQTKLTYHYNIQGQSLVLSPTGPNICIEGCASKYVKVGN